MQAGRLKSQSQKKKVHVQVEHSVRPSQTSAWAVLLPQPPSCPSPSLPPSTAQAKDSNSSPCASTSSIGRSLTRSLALSTSSRVSPRLPPLRARARSSRHHHSLRPYLPRISLSATAKTGVADFSIDPVCVSLGVMLVIFFGVRPRSSLRQAPTRPPCLPMTLTHTPRLSNPLAAPQLFNKIAGVYGLFGACFAGGTIGQLSFYIYSTASLAGFVWGLKAVVEVRIPSVRFPFAITDDLI